MDAHISLEVNVLAMAGNPAGCNGDCDCCISAEKGLDCFVGGPRETGMYAVPTDVLRTSRFVGIPNKPTDAGIVGKTPEVWSVIRQDRGEATDQTTDRKRWSSGIWDHGWARCEGKR